VTESLAAQIALHGTSLVEAGAGTGKTHTIVDLYLRMLLERRLRVPQVLVVTYTLAATAELRGRIRRRLVALTHSLAPGADCEWLREALRSFDQAAIFTIHGFCQRALQEHAFESGRDFDCELVSEAGPLLSEVAQDFWARELYAAPRFQVDYAKSSAARLLPSRLAQLAERISARPDSELRPARPRPAPPLEALEKAWQRAFDRVAGAWAVDADAVLELLARASEAGQLHKGRYRPETIRTRWRAAMAEEMRRRCPGIARRFGSFPRLGKSGLSVNKNQIAPEHSFFELCDELVRADADLERGLAQWAAGFRHDFVDYARIELARRKQEREILFFDDLLQGLRDAVAGERGEQVAAAIRGRYPVALIDEFQDTDPIQYEIFRRVWHDRPEQALILIGDPKQAIYAFRGADVLAYLEARSDAADSLHGLRCNRRADPGLVDALNAVFASVPAPFGREEIPYLAAEARDDAQDLLTGESIHSGLRILWQSPPAGEKELARARDGGDLSRGVASEVARLLSSDHRIDGCRLVASDIAVLTRTNRQARCVQTALREYGIVAVLQSEESVFATDEAAELERVMRAMAEPEKPARLRAALATTLLGREAGELLALVVDPEGAEWDAWVMTLRECRRIWLERSFVQALRALWVQRGVSARLLGRADGERRVTNLLHLGELLQRAGIELRLGPQALLHWFARRRREAEGVGSSLVEDAQLRLESDAQAVQLLTVHRSKGLQYPVTICPFLWDGKLARSEPFVRFHDPVSGELVLDAGSSDESKPHALREAHEESLRLLYVALTRARHHCSVVWGRFKDAGTSPLAHLLHPLKEGEPRPGEPKAASRLQGRSDAELLADLDRVARLAPGRFVVEEWQPPPAGVAPVSAPGAGQGSASGLVSAQAVRRFATTSRLSSFSGLVAAARDAEEARDYDVRSGEAVSAVAPRAGAAERIDLADFPAGALPGILIHEIFEKLDFTAAEELPSLVASALSRRGFASRWREPLTRAMQDLLSVPLDAAQPASHLGALTRANRIDEMEFVLPVAASDGGLTAEALGRVFAEHARRPWVRRYAERATALGFPVLAGYLRGFIDLVARRDGRFSIIDYKSNRLGPCVSDYAPERLEAAMLEHDYVLQYHLYLVALHRHLALRLPGYDYDQHVAGAWYLFVRGMSTSHPAGWGIVQERPPRALIEALSELLE
jgi:exodeoxyribonuclease V beta subunit